MWCEISVLPTQQQERDSVKGMGISSRLSDHVLFFPFPRWGTRRRRRVGKSYLEGVLKEIHVGINPDIIESAPLPSSPHIPSVCALQC